MARELTDRDIKILTLMAPEFSGETCKGSGVPYKSLLPPVANHYARNVQDFSERINRLNPDDFMYLIELMVSGQESLHCLRPDFYAILEKRIKEVAGVDMVRRVGARYALECD